MPPQVAFDWDEFIKQTWNGTMAADPLNVAKTSSCVGVVENEVAVFVMLQSTEPPGDTFFPAVAGPQSELATPAGSEPEGFPPASVVPGPVM